MNRRQFSLGMNRCHFSVGMFALLLLGSVVRAALPSHGTIADSALSTTALQPGQQAVAAVVLEVKDGFHAQSNKPLNENFIAFTAKAASSGPIKVLAPILPAGTVEEFGNLGKLSVYTGRITIYIPLEVKSDAEPGDTTIDVVLHFQACDKKACYPPEDVKAQIPAKIVAASQAIQPNKPELFKDFDPSFFSHSTTAPTAQAGAGSSTGAPPGAANSIGGFSIENGSYLIVFSIALLVGIIFNVMPCVLPVLPLKAIGFYEVSQHNRARSIQFGAVFSAGLITVFAVLGLLVVVFRVLAWGEIYTNPWFLAGIVLILLVMAISTFGFFTVNLPPAIYNISPRHDTYWGNFVFGVLTAILSTPCTFGMFLGLLVWATRQPSWVGLLMMMTVGLGMALPYLILSAFPEVARRFPRTGPWSELVKQMMSFLLLGAAVYFARRFIEPFTGEEIFWWLLFAVAVVAAIYLIIRTVAISERFVPRLVGVGFALLIVVPALVLTLWFVNQPYQWKPYSEAALADARKSGKVTLIEFTAAWCANCKTVETFVLHNSQIVADVKKNKIVMLRADLTQESAPGWPLLKQLNPVAAIPFTAIYPPGEDNPARLTGIYSVDDLRNAIDGATHAKIASSN